MNPDTPNVPVAQLLERSSAKAEAVSEILTGDTIFQVLPGMKPEEIFARMEEINPEALTCDGYDKAIIGYVERCGQPAVFCYDAEKMIKIAMRANKWTYEEAVEFLEFNTFGAYVGEHTPMFFYRFSD